MTEFIAILQLVGALAALVASVLWIIAIYIASYHVIRWLWMNRREIMDDRDRVPRRVRRVSRYSRGR